jgi:hypothetical protein
MVAEVRVTIYEVKGRHLMNLPSQLINDSAFPFEVREELKARIEDGRLIIERAKAKKTTKNPSA